MAARSARLAVSPRSDRKDISLPIHEGPLQKLTGNKENISVLTVVTNGPVSRAYDGLIRLSRLHKNNDLSLKAAVATGLPFSSVF